MATPKWDLTRPPFIDPRVWAVAIKRKKSGWNIRYYLWLMTVEPTDVDVTLRASNSKMNKDYGWAPAGLREAKSVLSVIQERSDNLSISYRQARSDVYDALEWIVCDMQGGYGSPDDNEHNPLARAADIFGVYPQMSWFFFTDLFLQLIKMGEGSAYNSTRAVIRGVQSAILQNLENPRFGVAEWRPSMVYHGSKWFDGEATQGSFQWMKKNGFLSEEDIDIASGELWKQFQESLSGGFWSPSYMLRRICGDVLGDQYHRIDRGFAEMAAYTITGEVVYDRIRETDVTRPFFADRFRDFIRRWPPSKPSGDVIRRAANPMLWAAGGAAIGAIAAKLSKAT
jgi:hypothetical protein